MNEETQSLAEMHVHTCSDVFARLTTLSGSWGERTRLSCFAAFIADAESSLIACC